MSEHDNVQLVESLYAAFARGDIQAALDMFSEDVALVVQMRIYEDTAPVVAAIRGEQKKARAWPRVLTTLECIQLC